MSLTIYQRTKGGPWYVRGTVRGSPEVNYSTKTDDEATAKKIRDLHETKLLNASIHGEVKNCTFMDAALSYLENGGDPTYVGEFKNGKWTKLLGEFGERIIRTITQDDLDAAARKLYPGCQPDTHNRQCHAPFITIWNRAERNEFCNKRSWERPKWRAGKYNGLSKRDMKRRVGTFPVEYAHAAEFVLAMSPAPAMLMTALFYTGMRPSELFPLVAEAVNVKDRWINLDWNTKTSEPRGVPIAEILVPLFTALVKRGGILFRTPRGEPYPIAEGSDKVSGQMKTAINGARRRSGIKDISPYTARHTVSSELVVAGVHPYKKDQILGHAVDDMSRDYTWIAQPHLIEAINKLPVIEAWANAPWMLDPLAHATALAGHQGERTDLAALKVRRQKRAKVGAAKAAAKALKEKRAARKVA